MIILSPGPSNISERVRSALMHPDIGHREPRFAELLEDIREKLLRVAEVVPERYESILLSGSGTLAIEAAVAPLKRLGRLLVVSNGVYGERAAQMARYHGVDTTEWRLGWGDEIRPEALATRMAETRPDAVYLVHHETTTGRLNDLSSLCPVAAGDGRLVLVDTISSLGGETLALEDWRIDAALGSANKCLRGVPGAAFVIGSRRFLDMATAEPAHHYASLAAHRQAHASGQTPYTPALHACFALQAALDETLTEGLAERRRHFAELTAHLMAALDDVGLDLLLPRDAYGHTLLSYHLPPGIDFGSLQARLRDEGYLVYDAQGRLQGQVFRLGLVGHFTIEDLRGFAPGLSRAIGKNSTDALR